MRGRRVLLLGTSLVASFLFSPQRCADAETVGGAIVRIAELEIDPAQLDRYKLALKEEIETSIRVEPGVLTLYAVSLKDHLEQFGCVRICAISIKTIGGQQHPSRSDLDLRREGTVVV